ncbi:DNA polymerase III subunit chi [Pseudoruegeria sp. SK021]|uniref:DNA polymerase III subunit chi n=1 Tax=Pseudoruegeria sp. SK021 TaxID=1933035 RepID=UPI000A218D4F|nr:DNA polymerase III subunit chi [Pseudoruegeria sp. SK021]OSP55417.1 DNA polymerase III subunit chi [Pseudoruegeria sp. SK021]
MGTARFYHMTLAPVEATLPKLLLRALDAGLRVELRATSPERLVWLDDLLWQGDPAGFLPHGLAGGAHDDLQPVLLTVSTTLAAATKCLISVDGAPVEPEDVSRIDRALVLFDGNDPEAVAHARGQWKVLSGAGVSAEYWSEDSGRWEKKAAVNAN